MSDAICFLVYGEPIPKGSMKAFQRKGMRYPVITHDNPKSRSWQKNLTLCAQQYKPTDLWLGPVSLTVTFLLLRPKSLPKRIQWPIKKPDQDKLTRVVMDALTGVFYRDDAQVCECITRKIFFERPGVLIEARPEVSHYAVPTLLPVVGTIA